jgi:nitrous oxide reductase accessory protein NosL
MNRRRFIADALAAGFVLTPLGAALTGCGKSVLPEGMVATVFDRDTCVRCKMAISDRRFVAQVKGGPKGENFKFDDIGCVTFWLREQAWGAVDDAKIWVADSFLSGADRVAWVDARAAFYVGGKTSPMGYNYGASAMDMPGALNFNDMRQHLLTKGK